MACSAGDGLARRVGLVKGREGSKPAGEQHLRVAADHWQRVAADRTAALEALTRRPVVRAALAADRRLAPLLTSGRSWATGSRAGLERVGLVARSWGAPRQARRRLNELERANRLEPPSGGPDVELVEIVRLPDGPGAVRAAADALRSSVAVHVALLPHGVEPLAPGWAGQLAREVTGGVAVATPTIVHGDRRGMARTPHDGLVRALGVAIADVDGVPVPSWIGPGSLPDLSNSSPVDVPLASAAGVVIDRAAAEAIGGLRPLADIDAAVLDLCCGVRGAGQRVLLVPNAVVIDSRPVRRAAELRHPVDPQGVAWRNVVEARGSLLQHIAQPNRSILRIACTVAAPSRKVARRWGDWHLAEGLAGELRRLGHEVRLQTADQADDLAGRACDVHLAVRGLRPVRRTVGQVHVLWIISHPEAIDDVELDEADLVLVASAPHAAVLRGRTATPIEVFLQATDHRRFVPCPPDPAHRHPVTIVAKSRDQLRPMVAAAVAGDLSPAIYGGGWERFVDPSLVVASHVENEDLPAVYASAGVVLNDHWETMRTAGFVSNRIFDVLACGVPVISDHMPEIRRLFGDVVPMWRRPEELPALVRVDLDAPDAARARATKGRELVLGAHTFEHRATELVAALGTIGVGGRPGGGR